jgi:RimJ/RimL family protein N-acetyltransferase
VARQDIAIRPLRAADRQALLAFFDALSDETRYRRFLSPVKELGATQLDYFTNIDHHDHEAVVAVEPELSSLVGVARYVRFAQHPDEAEVAVTVADEYQGQGVGTHLMHALVDRARAEGVVRFDAYVMADNARMLDLLKDVGSIEPVSSSGGTIEVKLPIPPAGHHEPVKEWVRAGAAGHVKSRLTA